MPRLPPLALLLALAACKSGPSEADALAWQKEQLAKHGGALPEPAPAVAPSALSKHAGPRVAPGGSGPARYALLCWEAFDAARALQLVEYVDRFWREPGNDGYEHVLARLKEELAGLRFGEDPERTLQWIETPMSEPAWTPLAGRLVLRSAAGERVLHAFDEPEGRDRLMLPVHAPSCEVEGPIALALEELQPGALLVHDGRAGRKLCEDARARGAAAVLSCSLEDYNTDRSGKQ